MGEFKVKPLIIQISGKKRAGKDTLAQFLRNIYQDQGKSVEVLSYAEPLKQIAADIMWISIEQLDTFKNDPDSYKIQTVHNDTLMSITNYRHLLQTLGSEAMKKWFGQSVWADLLNRRITQSNADVIIIPDWRFKSEVIPESIKLRVLTHIESTDTHISEVDLDNYTDFNFYIDNRNYIFTQDEATALAERILETYNKETHGTNSRRST